MSKPETVASIKADSFNDLLYIAKALESNLIGRYVRVISDHNGQPFGRSKPSWKGQVLKITRVHVDLYNGIQLGLEGHEYGECFIPADEVEFA